MEKQNTNLCTLVKIIADNLDVLTVLDYLNIAHYGERKSIPCPIHNGKDNNFSIWDDGRAWTCFSHNCGSSHKRDGLNLFCLIQYGKAFPDLQPTQKSEVLEQTTTIAGIDKNTLSINSMKRSKSPFVHIPQIEKNYLLEIINDTSKLEVYGKSELYTSPLSQKIILFLAVAKSEGILPKKITREWKQYNNFNNYINRKE